MIWLVGVFAFLAGVVAGVALLAWGDGKAGPFR